MKREYSDVLSRCSAWFRRETMDTNELISIRNGDKSAYAEILKRFEPLIKSEVSECVRRLPAESDADPEELTSEAMLALYKAAVSYEPTEKVTFGLYAKICIHNRLISCVRKISSKRRRRAASARKNKDSTLRNTPVPRRNIYWRRRTAIRRCVCWKNAHRSMREQFFPSICRKKATRRSRRPPDGA